MQIIVGERTPRPTAKQALFRGKNKHFYFIFHTKY